MSPVSYIREWPQNYDTWTSGSPIELTRAPAYVIFITSVWMNFTFAAMRKLNHTTIPTLNNSWSAWPLRWRHNELDGVSDHQPHDCLLIHLFRRRSKKTSKVRVTGLCVGNSPGTGEFPAQMASNAENVSIWWRHHALGNIFSNNFCFCLYIYIYTYTYILMFHNILISYVLFPSFSSFN